jgi:hypothetical protein
MRRRPHRAGEALVTPIALGVIRTGRRAWGARTSRSGMSTRHSPTRTVSVAVRAIAVAERTIGNQKG